MNRRHVLAGASTIGVASLAGCLGAFGYDEHESSPAGVEASARAETGYEQTGIEPVVVERSVGFGPLTEEISVTNQLTEHEKAVDMGPLGRQRGAVFMTLTTPQISILGQQLNPIEEMSAADLVDLVEDNYDGIGDIEPETDEPVTILDQETTQSRFTASAEFDGADVDVYLHISESVETDDDLLVAIGVYPQELQSREEENVLALMESISSDADPSDSEEPPEDGNETDDDDDGTNDGNESDDDEDSDDGVLSGI